MAKRILLADDSLTIQKVVELTFSDGEYDLVCVSEWAACAREGRRERAGSDPRRRRDAGKERLRGLRGDQGEPGDRRDSRRPAFGDVRAFRSRSRGASGLRRDRLEAVRLAAAAAPGRSAARARAAGRSLGVDHGDCSPDGAPAPPPPPRPPRPNGRRPRPASRPRTSRARSRGPRKSRAAPTSSKRSTDRRTWNRRSPRSRRPTRSSPTSRTARRRPR